uniref:15-hydroxyprostaglandin dehydrogenase n=1 Tax=Photinus pyralis TaxID=7054 RepID=A0A1Y1N8K6_PHOPY
MFDVYGKVALVTGGASGLGFLYVKELLRNGIKGVTIADTNDVFGERAIEEIKNEYGDEKAIFVNVDVSDKYQLEEAFKSTIQVFENIDIVINNAGILNDANWEKEIQVNLNGTVNGTLLAFDHYIATYKSGAEGAIINISSIGGLDAFATAPIYTASKFGIVGLGQAYGSKLHYERNNIKVVTVCPGFTLASLSDVVNHDSLLGTAYSKIMHKEYDSIPVQSPTFLAKSVISIIQQSEPGSVWVVEGEEPPYEVEFPNRLLRKKKK